jgi:SAM-dependent methyltransferase
MLFILVGLASALVILAWLAHFASYRWIKERALAERRWDYNICCGTTDGGGINADIVQHATLPRFELISDVTRLPHPDGAFEHVLCSHTIEHVPDPKAMYQELRRIGKHVTILVPPLWDFTAALNPFEHQVIFLSLASRHENELPPFFRFAPARWLQARFGQRINADHLSAGSRSSISVAAHFATPVLFLAALITSGCRHPMALLIFALGWGAFWLSHRRFRASKQAA